MMRLYKISLLPLLLLAGCAYLEPGVYDPELDDRKLSVHVLRSQSREAQRMVAGLRQEMEANRQTLAAAEVSRAQLQGRLREVERRYEEARQVIDLQREELARLRDEREEVLKASRELKNQMSRLQRQLASLSESYKKAPAPGPAPVVKKAADAPLLNGAGFDATVGVGGDLPAVVTVQPGDTLWSIARRYEVSYPALRSLNGLDENPDLILVGQELLLPE